MSSFIESRLADELIVFISPQTVDPGPAARALPVFDIAEIAPRLALPRPVETQIGCDIMLDYCC